MRIRASEARRIIDEELEREGWPTCSSLTVGEGPRPGARDLAWWNEKTPPNETSETSRSIAYLRAYHRIGGDKLFAGGLFLERRRLWMDRSVISRLERDGYLTFEGAETAEPWFALTERGESLILPSRGP